MVTACTARRSGNPTWGYGTVFALSIPNDYVWNVASGGSWTTSGKWIPAGPPDGAGNTADFSQQTLAANATVTLDGSRTIGNLIFGDQGNAYNWTLAPGSGGTLTLQVSTGPPTITVNNQTTTISVVLSGSEGLSLLGSGKLVLTASNTYTGPTSVNQGNLAVNGSLASAVTVNSGGTLGGTGNLTSGTVDAGGQIAPGSPLGTMYFSGGLFLASGAQLDYDLDLPGTSSMISCGNLVVGSPLGFSNFDFTHKSIFEPGTYLLIEANSLPGGSLGRNISGTIDGLAATLAVQGNEVVLNVVPEPTTLVLLGNGLAGLAVFRFARRKKRPETLLFPRGASAWQEGKRRAA